MIELRWNRRWALAVLVLSVLAGVLAWRVLAGREGEPVSVDEAVAGYRAERAAGAPASAVLLPRPGVYVYATTGFEEIDALTGERHRYPARTTVTVTHRGCGLLLRWTALRERSTTWDVCPRRRAWELRSVDESHVFFGRAERSLYRCSRAVFRPGSEQGWPATCVSGETTESGSGEVVGRETLLVGDTPVDTVHVRVRAQLGGPTSGTVVKEWWLRRRDGLPVRHVERNETTTSSAIGDVHYRERFTITLVALAPRR